jgi:methylmalonyl-CoA carboxyltransferase large subunit
MKSKTVDLTDVMEAVESLRAEVAHLHERLTTAEAKVGTAPAPPKPAAPTPIAALPPAPEQINEELVLVISAAVAAYFGCKPHIRQIRLLSGATWVQQGRVTIQASHALSVRHS